MKSIETRDLKPGMILAFTHDEVLTHPVSLLKTAKGKVDFAVRTRKGHIVQKTWNKHTLVNILTDEIIQP